MVSFYFFLKVKHTIEVRRSEIQQHWRLLDSHDVTFKLFNFVISGTGVRKKFMVKLNQIL